LISWPTLAVLATFAGAATLSEVELQTQSWYFAFQLIQVFLITTFTSGATAVASQIVSDSTQAVPLLAKNLPKASKFYISYFVLYGVANAAKYLINIGSLVGIFVLNRFANTPRKKYDKWMALAAPSWGSEYPKWTNMGVIALSYAIIAPLVLGFATVGMGLIYLAYRYNMLYVHNTQIDTKGACYARALQQLMVGIYLAEICLLGLFRIGIGSRATAIGPVVLQVVLIATTIVFHFSMRKKLYPITYALPLNLIVQSEYERHAAAERGQAGNEYTADQSMHPGFETREDSGLHSSDKATPEDGLVSGSPTSQYTHTHTVSNDIGHDAHSQKKRSLFRRLFMSHTQSVESLSASLGPRFRRPVPAYAAEDARQAYLHPTTTHQAPVIWLARDDLGISRTEVGRLRDELGEYGVEVTDDGVEMDAKGKVQWEAQSVRQAPLWEEKVVY
jgi:hypothetical protein